MPKIDIEALTRRVGASYPPPFDAPCAKRARRRLGDAGGLTDFGVNLLELPPGTWSSQRHWHSAEDEFVWVLSGTVTLIDDHGEQPLRAGECAAFAMGEANGHHLVNRGSTTAVVLEVGSRDECDACTYPDIDLKIGTRSVGYLHRNGTPYADRSR